MSSRKVASALCHALVSSKKSSKQGDVRAPDRLRAQPRLAELVEPRLRRVEVIAEVPVYGVGDARDVRDVPSCPDLDLTNPISGGRAHHRRAIAAAADSPASSGPDYITARSHRRRPCLEERFSVWR